jgi:general secretion pathway protein J
LRRAEVGESSRRFRRRDGGFTLLELLLAIVLMSLLTAMLIGGFRMITRNQEKAVAPLDRAERIANVYDFLRAQLADAQPAPPSAPRTTDPAGRTARRAPFDGIADGIRFVGPPAASLALGGLQMLTVGFADGRLAVRWRLYQDDAFEGGEDRGVPDAAGRAGTREDFYRDAVLLDHVADVRFAYFGSLDPAELPVWRESWLESDRLPLLVRMTVVFDDGYRPPALLVALRLALAPAVGDTDTPAAQAATPPARRRVRRE